MKPIYEWWDQASNRDQLLILFAGILIAIFVLYVLILKPIQTNKAKQIKKNETLTSSLSKVRSMSAQLELKQSGGANANQGGGALAEQVGSSLRENNLPFSNITPSGSNDVRVRFDQANFDNLMAWLSEMESQLGLLVKDFSVNSTNDEGFVAITLRLSKGV